MAVLVKGAEEITLTDRDHIAGFITSGWALKPDPLKQPEQPEEAEDSDTADSKPERGQRKKKA